jgi:hypothetical protein
MDTEDSLKSILLGTSLIPPSIDPVSISSLTDLFTLKITDYAFDRAMYIVQTAFEIAKNPVESYWFYVGKDDRPNLIEDVIVPHQSISHAFVSVSISEILEMQPEIRKQLRVHQWRVLGWGHSHADFGVFFSGTDWINQSRIFHETMNYARIEDEQKQILKYSYGTTFNIHKNLYGNISFQRIGKNIEHAGVVIKVVPNSEQMKLDKISFKQELNSKLSYK